MKKFLAALALALVPFTFAAPAEATRYEPGATVTDYCRNLDGVQSIFDWNRTWEYTPRTDDGPRQCRWIR